MGYAQQVPMQNKGFQQQQMTGGYIRGAGANAGAGAAGGVVQ